MFKAVLAAPTPVGQATIGEVAAAAANPAVIAELMTITLRLAAP